MSETIQLDPIEVTASRPEPATLPAVQPEHVSPTAGPLGGDDLTLLVDGKVFGGWDEVSVTRSCEAMPSSFDISLTERYPGELGKVVIDPGLPCQVKLGGDLVITGYIDRYVPVLDARRHSVRMMGRSKSQDLVDCQAIFDGFEINGQTVAQIARTLAGKYGIEVAAPTGEGPLVPQLNFSFLETTWDIIEQLSRSAKFLAYDTADGNVVLRPVSEEKHSSGVSEGTNLLGAAMTFAMDGRFSQYEVYPQTIVPLLDGSANTGITLPPPLGRASDTSVKRLRLHRLVLEYASTGGINEAARQRSEWEQARRAGRSECLVLVVDSWRDSSNRLWEPNRLLDVDVPACKVLKQTWIIGSVTFLRGASGTTARLTLMPPKAFDPQYVSLSPFNYQLNQALDRDRNNFNAEAPAP